MLACLPFPTTKFRVFFHKNNCEKIWNLQKKRNTTESQIIRIILSGWSANFVICSENQVIIYGSGVERPPFSILQPSISKEVRWKKADVPLKCAQFRPSLKNAELQIALRMCLYVDEKGVETAHRGVQIVVESRVV